MLFGSRLNRLATSIRRGISKYSVGSDNPGLVFDFIDNFYQKDKNQTVNFDGAITHARSGNAVMTDGYGPELVVNGGFDSDSDWTKGTGWTISDGKATNDGTINAIYLPKAIEEGKVYACTVDITFHSAGVANWRLGNTTNLGVMSVDAKSYTQYLVGSADGNYIGIFTNTSITIDNVSVRAMPVLKWAPHNLLQYSEQFDNGAWTKASGVTIQANQTVAPDGTQTADNVTYSSGGAGEFLRQSIGGLLTGQAGTFAVWVKSISGNTIFALDQGNGVSSGALTATSDWQLFQVSFIKNSNNWLDIQLGSGGGGVISVWGAHAYRSDLGGMADNPDQPPSRASYVPTTSSAEYLPRVGHHVYNGSAWVNEGLLAESEARTNIITGNDDLDNTTYWQYGGNLSATKDSSVAAPDGGSAWKLTNGTVGNFYFTSNVGSIAPSTGNYITISCYLKKGSAQYALLGFGGSTHSACVFDLNSNTVTDTSSSGMGAPTLTTTVESVGNGWFRVGFTHLQDANNPSRGVSVYPWTSSTVPASLDGHGVTGASETLYVAFPQAEYYATPSSLIPTSGSSVTRPAETFTIPSANLPWPEPNYIGSELVTNGTFDTDVSGWTADSDGTISYSNGTLLYTGTSTGPTFMTVQQDGIFTAGKLYRIGVDLVTNSDTANEIRLRSNTTSEIGDMTATGSYEFFFLATGSDSYLRMGIVGGLAGESFSIDNVSVREIDPLSVSIAMDGRATFADTGTYAGAFPYLWDADNNNAVAALIRGDGANAGKIDVEQKITGVRDVVTAGRIGDPDVLVPYNIAQRSGSTFLNGAVDGVEATANTTPTSLIDLSATDLDLASTYMGTIGTFRVWDKDLGDDGIVEATNPSLEPSLSLTFEGTGTNSFVVNNWSE